MTDIIAEDIHQASLEQLLRWWRQKDQMPGPLSAAQFCDEVAWSLLSKGEAGRNALLSFLKGCDVESSDLTPDVVDRVAAAVRFASHRLLPENQRLIEFATRGAHSNHHRIRMASLATLMEFGWFTLDDAFVNLAVLGDGKDAAFAALMLAYQARWLAAKGNGEEKSPLVEAMKSDNPFAREHACDEISHQHLTGMIDYITMLRHDGNPSVSDAARHGLETIRMRQSAPRYFKRES